MKTFEKVHIDSTVAAGNQIVVSLPIGKTYETLVLETNIPKADIQNIRLNINGRLISEFADAVQMETIDKYLEKKVEDGKVFIHFLAQEFDDPQYQRAFSLGTSGADTVDVTFKVASDTAEASPTIEAYAVKSPATPPGTLRKVRSFPLSVAAGVTDFADITRVDGARIKAIHVFKSGNDINKLELEVDKTLYAEASKSAMEAIQKMYNRSPQAGVYTIDFCLQGDVYELFKIPNRYVADGNGGQVPNPHFIRDLRLRMDCATGGQVYIVVEYMDVWNPTGF